MNCSKRTMEIFNVSFDFSFNFSYERKLGERVTMSTILIKENHFSISFTLTDFQIAVWVVSVCVSVSVCQCVCLRWREDVPALAQSIESSRYVAIINNRQLIGRPFHAAGYFIPIVIWQIKHHDGSTSQESQIDSSLIDCLLGDGRWTKRSFGHRRSFNFVSIIVTQPTTTEFAIDGSDSQQQQRGWRWM